LGSGIATKMFLDVRLDIKKSAIIAFAFVAHQRHPETVKLAIHVGNAENRQ
jgi:hypothetical protein